MNNRKKDGFNEDTNLNLINHVYKEQYKTKCKRKGISTLCPAINKLIGGIQPGEITTIAGTTGSMKTTYAVNIGYQAALSGKNVLFLSFEETAFALYSKLLSRHAISMNKKIPANLIYRQELDLGTENDLLDEVYVDFEKQDGKFLILDSSKFTELSKKNISEMIRRVELYLNELYSDNNKGIDLIIVDHLQILKFSSKDSDEKKVMNDFVTYFRKISNKFGNDDREIAVILISQINRDGMKSGKRNNGLYSLYNIAEANEIERASSVILTVYTDAQTQITKNLMIGAIKLRNAQLPLDTIITYADGEYYQVGSVEVPEQADYTLEEVLGNSNLSTSSNSTQEITADMSASLLDGLQ